MAVYQYFIHIKSRNLELLELKVISSSLNMSSALNTNYLLAFMRFQSDICSVWPKTTLRDFVTIRYGIHMSYRANSKSQFAAIP